ncbi:copper amine oxidase N-terminal domain-containing protein, partial [Peptoniphilus sp. SGI.035]|uniref:copper amine oxidase N-terminal domain-containing protein n=2 Tax=unclassified Peptoniphilus TaxID=2637196 RepID=UPI003CFBCC3B
DNEKVTKEIPAKAIYKDKTKEFKEWDSTVPTEGEVVSQEFDAIYKAKALPPVTPVDPEIVGPVNSSVKPNPDPNKYWTVKFETADASKGTVAEANTVYVLKTANKTLADITAPATTPAKGYEFEKWTPALDSKTAIDKDITVNANFKEKAGTKPVTPGTKPVTPGTTPSTSLDDEIDVTNKKSVLPINEDQGTGVIIKNTDNIKVVGKDEDRKNIPSVINGKGEIVVNPGSNVDGPIIITVTDTKTKESEDIVISVIGHTSGRDDNSDEYWYTPWLPRHSDSTSTTKVTTNTTKKPSIINAANKSNSTKLEVRLVIGPKTMRKSIDGVEENINIDVAPFIEKGRTMLPIRFVAEALGFNVQWDNENRTVILIDKENVVKIPVDTKEIIVNGKVYESDVKPVIKNDRTMLPIANIARALGLKDGKDIIWNGTTKEVVITREIAK